MVKQNQEGYFDCFVEKRLEGSPGSHLLTASLGCHPSIIPPLDYSFNFFLLSGSFYSCQSTQLDFAYPKRLLLSILPRLTFISLYQIPWKREVYIHCLHILPVDSFAVKLFSFTVLQSHQWPPSLMTSKFDDYFLVLILLE